MKKFSTLMTLALAMLVSSCLQYDRDEGLQLTKALRVSIAVDDMESVATKSAVTAQDATAENFNIWLYDDKGLVFDGYYTDADNIKVDKLVVGTTYHVRAVANVGLITPPTSLAQADALAFDWDISGLNVSAGVPMAYKESFTLAITSALDIHFRRAVAKYTFIIDQSGFSGTYTIKSLRLCNAPSKVLAFADSKIDGSSITAVDGDYATGDDLGKLNQGLGVHYFIYENNQGEVLSGNTDPWKKEFVNYNNDKAAYASKCTYLEVLGDYTTTGINVSDLKYRIYLGKNATTNFDVTRNTAYTVVLGPQDAAALDEDLTSWKVEKGTISDARGLAFSPASIEVPSMGQASATVVPTPSNLEYVLEPGDNFTAAGLTYEQAGNGVTVKSGSIVAANTSAKLVARTTDGTKTKALNITVLPPTVTSVTVSPADGWSLAKGTTKDFTATATFSAGDPADVTQYASWSGGSYLSVAGTPSSVATMRGTAVSAANAATVTATYGGKSGSSRGTVTAPTLTAITVSPASKDMEQGEQATFSVVATYSDGSTGPLSDGITWSSSDNAGLRSDGAGKFTAVSLGGFTVTASAGGLEGNATVSVTPKFLGIEISQDPEGDIKYGTSKTLSVTAHYSDSSYDKDVTAQCTFTPSANLTQNGSVFVGSGLGAASVKAAYNGSEDTASFNVVNDLKRIYVLPGDGWTLSQNDPKTFSAMAEWLVGEDTDVTADASWSCNENLTKDGSVKGKFTGVAVGEASVTATYEGKEATSTGSVVAQLTKIELEADPSGDILFGATKNVKVKATYSDGTSSYVTADALFSGYDEYLTKGSISGQAMPFTGKKVGSVTLTATYGGKEATLTFNVGNGVASLSITPAGGWEMAIGEDKPFTAIATMLDGSTPDVTSSATWSTTTSATLTKKATAGLFSGKAAGTATVKAEYEGKSATSTGTVKEDVYSYRIVLSGSSVAVMKGKTAGVTPTVMYYVTKNGVEDGGTDVTAGATLKSKNTGVATVSGTTVTGVAVGTTKLYAEYNNGSQVVSSDKATGGSYIDVTVSDKSVDRYEYNEPILELSYGDVGADGSAASPTLTYSQTATRVWSDGSTDENVVIAAAGSAIPSGVTVTWGGSAKYSSGGSINSGNGKVTAKNRETTAYSRGVVFNATASATINGVPGSTAKDVYQQTNQVVSTVEANSKTENSGWSVGTYQESGFSNISSSGGTATFKTYVYHTATVYKKYTRTWTSGSSVTSDWEYVSSSEPYDNVTISSNQSWAHVSPTSTGGDFNKVTITVDANSGAARSATITLTNTNGNSTTRTISQQAGVYETGRDYDVKYNITTGGTRSIDTRTDTEDKDYAVSISPTSKSVSAAAGSFSITASGSYNHYTYYYKQNQQWDKYSLKDVIHYSDGSTSDTNIRTNQSGDWYNVGSEYKDESRTTVEGRSGTPELSSNQSWMHTDGSYDANATTSPRSATITATLGGVEATLTVSQAANQKINTETETDTQNRVWPSNSDYWIKINDETSSSKDVDASAGSVAVNVTAGHTHSEQPQISTCTREKYTWQVGDPTYSNWSSWSDWVNNGDPTITYPSDEYSLSVNYSASDWLRTDGSYNANSSTVSSRSGTITAKNKSNSATSATLTVNQAKKEKTEYEIDVE